MTLFTASQHVHRSLILFCNIRLRFQYACLTLQNPIKRYNDNNNIITLTLNNKTSYLFEVRLPKCIKLSINTFKNFLHKFLLVESTMSSLHIQQIMAMAHIHFQNV